MDGWVTAQKEELRSDVLKLTLYGMFSKIPYFDVLKHGNTNRSSLTQILQILILIVIYQISCSLQLHCDCILLTRADDPLWLY